MWLFETIELLLQERKKICLTYMELILVQVILKCAVKKKNTILNEKNIIAIANKKDLLAFGDEAL